MGTVRVRLTDERILDETELPSDPVSLDSDEHLTDNDTRNLEVLDRVHPPDVARLVGPPALRPHGREQRGQVSDREQRRTLSEETEAANHVAGAVGLERRERVLEKRKESNVSKTDRE